MRKHPELQPIKPALRALFAEIGTPERLLSLVTSFYESIAHDPLIGFFFDGRDLPHIAERQTAFLLRAMGATPSYEGKSPSQAHASLPPILKGHFDRRLKLLEAHLRSQGLSEPAIHAWVNFEESFRKSILGTS